jgi:hypothetical protein
MPIVPESEKFPERQKFLFKINRHTHLTARPTEVFREKRIFAQKINSLHPMRVIEWEQGGCRGGL